MPCNGGEQGCSVGDIQAELDKVTALLCNVCRRSLTNSKANRLTNLTNEELGWYNKHVVEDNIRRETEAALLEKERLIKKAKQKAIRARVISQLTKEEREACGL